MTDYANLIAALEAAKGPSRGLDAQIEDYLHGLPEGWVSHPHAHQTRYTESIDAALSFTPEGHQWAVLQLPDGTYDAAVTPIGVPPLLEERESPTPAIALCIANLRALGAQEETNG